VLFGVTPDVEASQQASKVPAAGHEHDGGAVVGELAGDGGADAAARAGDDRGGAGTRRSAEPFARRRVT
jgi:hypothetical protein